MRLLAVDMTGVVDKASAFAGASANSSEELVVRARSGDEEAFRTIFERYTRPVISFIFYMVNRRELAEELAQETFVRAYKSIGTLRDEAKVGTWLFGIAKNVARESLRSRLREARNGARYPWPEASDEQSSPDKILMEKELMSVMGRALDALDEDKRLVFTLKVYQQHSYEEISEITGFSLPKIRNDIYRARAELRRRLSLYLGGENDL
jgi:RNA polymerase sigma-70 factor (ECF subfamily)